MSDSVPGTSRNGDGRRSGATAVDANGMAAPPASLRGARLDGPGADGARADYAGSDGAVRDGAAGSAPPAAAGAEGLAAALAELTMMLVDEVDLAVLLQRIAELADRTIEDCDSAGVTLVVDGRATTAAATDPRTLAVDAAQYQVGDGPCLESFRVGRVQRVIAPAMRARYPEFAAAARERGIRSVLAAPLIVRGRGIGALNLYSADSHGFTTVDETLVAAFAAQAAVAVANAQTYRSARVLADQLGEAMANRAVIEQAKGVLMATYAVDADGAFHQLRVASQAENRKLRTVAAEVVEAASAGRPVALRT